MNKEIIEEKRNELNLDIRVLLSVIDLIDGDKKQYENYVSNSLDELEFLEQQINLVNDAKERLLLSLIHISEPTRP